MKDTREILDDLSNDLAEVNASLKAHQHIQNIVFIYKQKLGQKKETSKDSESNDS